MKANRPDTPEMNDMPVTPESCLAPTQETRGVASYPEDCGAEAVVTRPDADDDTTATPKVLWVLLMAYLVLDYGRPQDAIPGLGSLRPAMVVTALLAVAFFTRPRMWVRGNAQHRGIWAFVAILIVHVPFAVNTRNAYNTATYMLLFLPFVLSLPVCMTSMTAVRRVLGFCVVLMAYQAGYAVLHTGHGTGSVFTDENDLALYVNAFLPFAYFLSRTEKTRRVRLLYAGGVLLGVAGIVSTMSRGGFVGLLALGVAVSILSPRKIVSLALIGVIVGGLVMFAGDSYWKRMSTATDAETGTGRARVESWKSGWAMFVDNPLGVGGGNFQVRFPEYQTEYFRKGMWGRVAHSLWLTLFPELGVPGTIVYGLLLLFNLRDCFRIRAIGRSIGGYHGRVLAGLGSAFLASLVGFFASATFLSVLYYPHYWYLTGLVVATARVGVRLEMKAT